MVRRSLLQKPEALWIGARNKIGRAETVEQYVALRMRSEDINRHDFLLNGLHTQRITLPSDSPFSAKDLKDTVRKPSPLTRNNPPVLA